MSDANAAADAGHYAEIGRYARRRLLGVYLAGGAAALMLVGVSNSMRMMHGTGWSTAEGRIVALGKDASNGETTMTSEFADANGTLHRDTQPASYHYAPGEPQVGQRIGYRYKNGDYTGDFISGPRADVILHWFFGSWAALFILMAAITGWIVLRQRNSRRRLVRQGRRERGEQYTIRQRAVPFGNGVQMWRLEARYFEPTRFEFVDCYSDWQTPPEPPQLTPDMPFPPIFVDNKKPARYWLPVGSLAQPKR